MTLGLPRILVKLTFGCVWRGLWICDLEKCMCSLVSSPVSWFLCFAFQSLRSEPTYPTMPAIHDVSTMKPANHKPYPLKWVNAILLCVKLQVSGILSRKLKSWPTHWHNIISKHFINMLVTCYYVINNYRKNRECKPGESNEN